MQITLELIKELREKSGAGMADCKKALQESDGDIKKAIEYLRKKGAAMATKRADKIAKEGAIKASVNSDNTSGVIIEVNCETDFVAKGDDFQNFAQSVADTSLISGTDSLEVLLKAKGGDGLTIQENIDGMMGKVGEKIEFKRAKLINVPDGFVAFYIHFGSKVGGMVGIKGKFTEELHEIGKKMSMQVVAMNPISVKREDISADVIEKEKEIYAIQCKNEGKPEKIIDKIIQNKVEKFYQENCLLEQEYIQDSSKCVGDLLKEYTRKTGEPAEVTAMVRYQLG
ncbi:MAG: elongation factor Ts [Ignavibacteriae bacterium]|nr:elongation factor Ts [Ignavibacteriota bacterium]